MSNIKYMDKEVFCLKCGISLGVGYRAQKRKYCSNQCQRLAQEKMLQEAWLDSGRLASYTGGQSGNTPRGKYLRRLIIEEQKNLCAECHQPAIHNNKPLKFLLDHADGDPTNNARENLRLVCPNCDSQSDTYKGRNRGKGRRSKGFTTNKGL